ncbi:MAG: hypothetical protein MMC33_000568 [Icmadophila ericetorum]|nr:hypothetical protein [Icmadophila ericetorum]
MPPQPMRLVIAANSDVTWVLATDSPLCQNDLAPGEFSTTYKVGFQGDGDYFNDEIMIGCATLTKITLGLGIAGNFSSNSVEGILGLGSGRDGGTGSGGSENYANVLDTLKSQGYINTRAFSIWLNDEGQIPLRVPRTQADSILRSYYRIHSFG